MSVDSDPHRPGWRARRPGRRRVGGPGEHRATRRRRRQAGGPFAGSRFAAIGVAIAAVAWVVAVAVAPSNKAVAGGELDLAGAATAVRDQVAKVRVDPAAAKGPRAAAARAQTLPTSSGNGKRIVFDMSQQRVWLVRENGAVRRTYPVSGSTYDNLSPGTYKVYSRSRHATSYDLGSTMGYFVRFARGDNAAIGFHDIPLDPSGKPLQSRAKLGERTSSGCVRQAHPDAVALWRFASVGTKVVVLG